MWRLFNLALSLLMALPEDTSLGPPRAVLLPSFPCLFRNHVLQMKGMMQDVED